MEVHMGKVKHTITISFVADRDLTVGGGHVLNRVVEAMQVQLESLNDGTYDDEPFDLEYSQVESKVHSEDLEDVYDVGQVQVDFDLRAGKFTAEASELELDPGHWPNTIRVTDYEGKKTMFRFVTFYKDSNGDVRKAIYTSGEYALEIFND
jgi:hypothetical protein